MPETESMDTARGLDRSYISALIEKEYVGLRLLLARRTGDQIAADLLQEAVCITWEKWCGDQIQRPEQIAGYIFQVAMNLLRNHKRLLANRLERRASLEQLDTEQTAAPSAESVMEKQIAQKLKALIQEMDSQRDRTVLVRFYLDEDDKEKICRDLRLDARQFDRILYRARQRLGQLLSSHRLKRSDFLSVLL